MKVLRIECCAICPCMKRFNMNTDKPRVNICSVNGDEMVIENINAIDKDCPLPLFEIED